MGRLVKRFARVVPGEVLDARQQAHALLQAARDEAERLRAEARAEADDLRARAQERGEAEGRAQVEVAFTALMVAARADAARVHTAAMPAARALALRMAEKIVGQAVQLDPAAMVNIGGGALAAARARCGAVVLRVHPDDWATLQAARPALVDRIGAAAELRLVADASVGRAGCVVETPVGRLDARLSTQLAALERALSPDGAPGPATGRPHG